MDSSFAKCPEWLITKIEESGGHISFCEFMASALYDTSYGSYASGEISIGRKGDFVTSPSMGRDFAEMLALQCMKWFKQLKSIHGDQACLCLIDVGPGEGDLAYDLIKELEILDLNLFKNFRLILVEPNLGMKQKQMAKLIS